MKYIMSMNEENSALCEQVKIIENSQSLIRTIFLGLAMQYKSLDMQHQQLCDIICGQEDGTEPCPDPKAIQIGASLIILYALLGFQNQAKGIARQTEESGLCPDATDIQLGALVILVALIRLFRLAAPQPPAPEDPQQAQAQQLQELELAADPEI